MRSVINQLIGHGTELPPSQLATGLSTVDIMTRYGLPRPRCFDDRRMARLALATIPETSVIINKGQPDSIESKLGKAVGIDAAAKIIKEALIQEAADMLQMAVSEVDPQRSLSAYGVNSLVAIEVRNWISREIKVNVPLLDILAAISMDKLATKIAEMVKPSSNSTSVSI